MWIEESCIIGAGDYAVLATDALFVICQNHPVFALVRGTNRADRNAWRVFTVVAKPWKEALSPVFFLNLLYPGAPDTFRNVVFLPAGHSTKMAPDALVAVNHHPVFDIRPWHVDIFIYFIPLGPHSFFDDFPFCGHYHPYREAHA
jgi:hypothetical protein